MPNEQKTGYVASKRDLAKTENNSSMTKPVATVTNSTTDLSSIKQQSSSKITVSIYKVIFISILLIKVYFLLLLSIYGKRYRTLSDKYILKSILKTLRKSMIFKKVLA